MPATINEHERETPPVEPLSPAAYHAAEGFAHLHPTTPEERARAWRDWMMIGLGRCPMPAHYAAGQRHAS
jgi:hypothetical protein